MKSSKQGHSLPLKSSSFMWPKGSGSPTKEMTREQELERRVRKLEAENAYLKKSIALKAEKRSRTERKRLS